LSRKRFRSGIQSFTGSTAFVEVIGATSIKGG
jgi:hypothetical protein